jgi:hypothetical protein
MGVKRNPEYPFEIDGRVHNEMESKQIDTDLKELLDLHDIKYIEIMSDRQSINSIIDYIIKFQ